MAWLPCLLLLGQATAATTSAEAATPTLYPVSTLEVAYGNADTAKLPSLDKVKAMKVKPTANNNILPYDASAPQGGSPTVELSHLPANTKLSMAGLMSLCDLVKTQVAGGDKPTLGAVLVVVAPGQIDPKSGQDLRQPGDSRLVVDVWIGQLQAVRTVAKGTRHAGESANDNPAQQAILTHSPVVSGGLLRTDLLDDYLRRLNRESGRRVDAAVTAGKDPGQIGLDYLVTEEKPWVAYLQGSNAGTSQTGTWIERMGLIYYEPFKRGDTFSLDYTTAAFSKSHDILGSYSIPLVYPDYLQARFYGEYSYYQASQIGVNNLNFNGTNYIGGAEFRLSPFHSADWSVDLLAGAQWERIDVGQLTQLGGAQINPGVTVDLIKPYVGLDLERLTAASSTKVDLRVEHNMLSLGPLMTNLGRAATVSEPYVGKFDLSESFYLEPLVYGYSVWASGKNWSTSTMAEEIVLAERGQYTLDHKRTIPQEQYTVGGFYSVRGYPQSIVAADSGYVLSAEYRIHLPRLLRPLSEAKKADGTSYDRSPYNVPFSDSPFNLRAPSLFSNPNWDFMLKGFFDFGRTMDSHAAQSNGSEFATQTLMSAGGGAELDLPTPLHGSALALRLDVARVLRSLTQPGVNTPVGGAQKGYVRFDFSGTISF